MKTSLPDLSLYFERYLTLSREADAIFEHVRSRFPQEVSCARGCASCCHALFDLSLVEALYLNAQFNQRFTPGPERSTILDRADRSDRNLAKIKRKAYRDITHEGQNSNSVLEELAERREACPLLDDTALCLLYDCRPITCRFYGIPARIGDAARSCALTGFQAGQAYPTVFLDAMQERLDRLSRDLAEGIGTAYQDLASMYVPVSTVLLTDYTAGYLGLGGIVSEDEQ